MSNALSTYLTWFSLSKSRTIGSFFRFFVPGTAIIGKPVIAWAISAFIAPSVIITVSPRIGFVSCV